MEDVELAERFLAGTLSSFSHRDHVRVAYLLLCSHEFDDATLLLSNRIRAMAAASGKTDKFHVTRTVAWMRLIDSARSTDQASPNSEEFLLRHRELLRSTLLDEFYSSELLGSDVARARYVEPDNAPLP